MSGTDDLDGFTPLTHRRCARCGNVKRREAFGYGDRYCRQCRRSYQDARNATSAEDWRNGKRRP